VSDLVESHPEKLSNGRIRPRESDRAGFVWEQFQCVFQKFIAECHGGFEIFPLIIGIHRTAFSRFDVQLLRELERTEYLLYLFQSIVLPQKVLDLLKAGIIGWNIYDSGPTDHFAQRVVAIARPTNWAGACL
jgi:hypothetical protein